MASATKFQCFVTDLVDGVHDLVGTQVGTDIDDWKVYLSNTAPDVETDEGKADLAEISTGNGYTGPVSITPEGTASGGTITLTGAKVTITASGGAVGPFRYVVLYNDTSTGDRLALYWDYGASITLNDGEKFEIKFSGNDTRGNVLTIS